MFAGRLAVVVLAAAFLVGPASAREKVTALEGRVVVDLPDGFDVMSPEVLAVKYARGNAPDLVYTDVSTRVNLSLGLRPSPRGATPRTLVDQMAQMLPRLIPIVSWEDHGVREIDGVEVAYMHFQSPALESNDYNIENYQVIWLTPDDRMVMANFSCTTDIEECDDYRAQLVDRLEFKSD